MTDSTRGVRVRRGSRRPGWALLSALLVLAIAASAALVFTDRVELLKLAVILALWAAVVAAFVSFFYRRQADLDGAKVRDLKLVYDLQLDREISARREYELSVESQLRRELTSELRAEASDELAGLRAELAALRSNLEMLFDADLHERPAIETDRASVGEFRDWPDTAEGAGRVISSRIDAANSPYADSNTDQHPIIDVPAEPRLSGGSHRMSSDVPQPRHGSPEPHRSQFAAPTAQPPPVAVPIPIPETTSPAAEVPQDWPPFPFGAEFWSLADPPPSRVEPTVGNGSPFDYDARSAGTPEPAMTTAPAEPPPGRHSTSAPPPVEPERRGRHYSQGDPDAPGRPTPPPTLAAPSPPPLAPDRPRSARHRGVGEEQEESEESSGQHAGGQPLSELLSRLQASSGSGGRRRRRDQ